MLSYSSSLILTDLNDFCLDCIMQYLDFPSQINFARTCRRFKNLMISRWNIEWNAKELTLPVYQPCCDPESYRYFLNAISFTLESIYLPEINQINIFIILCENVQFPAMKKLSLIVRYQSDDLMPHNCIPFKKILSKCPNIIEIKLENIKVETSSLKLITRLHTLHLRRCFLNVSHNSLNDLFQLKYLTKLYLIELDGITKLPPLFSVVHHSALQELCLMHEFFIINPRLVEYICDMASLKTLVICFFEKYSKRSVADVFKLLYSKLSQRIRYFGFSPKFTSWPNLQLTDICLTNMSELRALEFYWTDLSLLEQMIPTYVLVHLTELEELILTYCRNIPDMYLLNMIKKCPKLKYVDLKECENLTDDFIWEAAKYSLMHDRRTLTINVTNSSLSTDINKHPDFWQYKQFLKIIDAPGKVPDFYKDCYYCYAFKFNDVRNF